MDQIAPIISALGGLGGIGALITALATYRRTDQIKAETKDLRPPDGPSLVDRVGEIAEMVQALTAQVNTLYLDEVNTHNELRGRIYQIERECKRCPKPRRARRPLWPFRVR